MLKRTALTFIATAQVDISSNNNMALSEVGFEILEDNNEKWKLFYSEERIIIISKRPSKR